MKEELIDKAATDSCVIDNGIINPQIVPYYEQGFKDGIRWLKKNIWHNASEEPTEKKALIILDNDGYIWKDDYMLEERNCTHWEEFVVLVDAVCWCYKDDLMLDMEE